MNAKTNKPLKLDLRPCASSAISHFGYDPATQTLALKFTSGAVYHYPDVSYDLFDGLQRAKSIGKYYAERIKGKYEGTEQNHYREVAAKA